MTAATPTKPRLGRPFGALVTGVLASNASDGFAYFAAPLLVLTITKDPVTAATATGSFVIVRTRSGAAK